MDVLSNVTIVTCPKMKSIARKIRDELFLKGPSGKIRVIEYKEFAGGEFVAKIPETVRNTDVILLHAFHPDPTVSFMKFLIASNALQLASPASIHLVLPHMPFQRQDRKDERRVPITARLIWDLIQVNPKITHALTIDMHSEQQQGFATIPVDNFPGNRIHAKYFAERFKGKFDSLVVVAPDFGGALRVKRLVERLEKNSGVDISVGILEKRRPEPGQAEVVSYTGPDLTGKSVILYDDMIDTGGTIIAAANAVKARGANEVFITATHAVFSKDPKTRQTAEEKLAASGHHVVVTNTIPRGRCYAKKHAGWLTILPIEATLSSVVLESFRSGGSVSRL